MSDYLADKINEHVFRGNAFTPPASNSLYVGLDWQFESSGMGGPGVSSLGYARVALPPMPARHSWEVGHSRNDADIVWATPTGLWGRPYSVKIYDDASAGNELMSGGGFGILGTDTNLSRWVSDKGTCVVYMGAQPANNDTITIDGITYRFVNTLSAAYDVKIGSNYYDDGTGENLILAITAGGTPGTHYGVGTVAHPTIDCPDLSFYSGYRVFEDLNQVGTVGILLVAKTAPGNGILVSTTSSSLWFERSTSTGSQTSGGGEPFKIPVHNLVASFQPGSGGTVMDYLSNKLYDWFFRGASFTPPTGLVLALYTTAPSTNDTGGVECADAGYSRQSISIGAYDSANNRARNSAAVTFGVAAAPYTIRAAVIRDGSDNPLYKGSLNQAISAGNQLRFNTTGSSYFEISYPQW